MLSTPNKTLTDLQKLKQSDTEFSRDICHSTHQVHVQLISIKTSVDILYFHLLRIRSH